MARSRSRLERPASRVVWTRSRRRGGAPRRRRGERRRRSRRAARGWRRTARRRGREGPRSLARPRGAGSRRGRACSGRSCSSARSGARSRRRRSRARTRTTPRRRAARPRAEDRLEVGPGGVGPVAGPGGTAVDQLVEDLRPRVAHPDLVGVRKGEAERELGGGQLLAHGVPLEAEIAPGPFDREEERLEPGTGGTRISSATPRAGSLRDARGRSAPSWQ